MDCIQRGKGEKSWLECIKCDPKDLRANGCKEGIVSSLQKVNCEMSSSQNDI